MSIPTLNRNDLAERLLCLPRELEAAESDLLHAQRELNEVKAHLDDSEALYTRKGLEGTNDAQRKAHLYLLTTEQRERVQAAQERVADAALRVRTLERELSAGRAVARLLGGE